MRRVREVTVGLLFSATVTLWILDRLPFMEVQR